MNPPLPTRSTSEASPASLRARARGRLLALLLSVVVAPVMALAPDLVSGQDFRGGVALGASPGGSALFAGVSLGVHGPVYAAPAPSPWVGTGAVVHGPGAAAGTHWGPSGGWVTRSHAGYRPARVGVSCWEVMWDPWFAYWPACDPVALLWSSRARAPGYAGYWGVPYGWGIPHRQARRWTAVGPPRFHLFAARGYRWNGWVLAFGFEHYPWGWAPVPYRRPARYPLIIQTVYVTSPELWVVREPPPRAAPRSPGPGIGSAAWVDAPTYMEDPRGPTRRAVPRTGSTPALAAPSEGGRSAPAAATRGVTRTPSSAVAEGRTPRSGVGAPPGPPPTPARGAIPRAGPEREPAARPAPASPPPRADAVPGRTPSPQVRPPATAGTPRTAAPAPTARAPDPPPSATPAARSPTTPAAARGGSGAAPAPTPGGSVRVRGN